MADSRGAYDPELCFFYNRIPKVANTSITSVIANAKGFSDPDPRQIKKLFSIPSSMTEGQVNDLLKNGFKFVFVRDPYSRVLSAYLDKVVRKNFFDTKIRTNYFSRNGKVPGFPEFLAYLEHEGLYANAHWAPQVDLLLMPLSSFDFIGRFENVHQDMQTVMNRLNLGNASLPNMEPRRTNASSLIDEYYSAPQLDMVARIYSADFSTFGYRKL